MGGSHSILIVEDEESLRHALEEKFTREGFTVFTAKNGEQGLTMALQEHPDVILLDIVMPERDGVSTLCEIRKDAWGKDARVMMLTNLNDEDKISEVTEQGCFDYLLKSDWHIDDVVEKVKQALDAK